MSKTNSILTKADLETLTGTVKWFNNATGYGFVVVKGMDDIFVHHSAIEMDGFRTLVEGDVVTFVLHTTTKGLQAMRVCVVESEEITK